MEQGSVFENAFHRSYEMARATHYGSAWDAIWGDTYAWTDFMLYRNEAVLRTTAASLNLKVCSGQPLRLDAVLSPLDAKHWFPMRVAVEHENASWTILNEIRSLLSVRSPLKVAITYCLGNEDPERVFRRLTKQIQDEFRTVCEIGGEDPNTEYLFLVGVERPVRELQWRSLNFTAGQGPNEVWRK